MNGWRGGSGETSGWGVARLPRKRGSGAGSGPSGIGAAAAGPAVTAASSRARAMRRIAALPTPRSGVEAESEPVERAQPEAAAGTGGVGRGEPVARELDDRRAQRLGRERHRLAADVPQPGRLGVAA